MLAISTMCPLLFLTISGPNARQVNLYCQPCETLKRGEHLDRHLADVPVTDQVDFEQLFDSLRRDVKDRVVVSDPCIVDQDARCAEFLFDLCSRCINSIWVGHVTFDVVRNH